MSGEALAGEGSSDGRGVASNDSMSGNVDKAADAMEVVGTVGAMQIGGAESSLSRGMEDREAGGGILAAVDAIGTPARREITHMTTGPPN